MSGKNYFDRGRKNYFEGEKADWIKDIFADEELKPSWEDGENTVTSDSVNMDDCHEPRGIEKPVYTEEQIQIWIKRARKDSTEQLNEKLNSDFFNEQQKTIFKSILLIRELKKMKK